MKQLHLFFQVGRIVDVLKDRNSHHNGFPVVDHHHTNNDEVTFSFLSFLRAFSALVGSFPLLSVLLRRSTNGS